MVSLPLLAILLLCAVLGALRAYGMGSCLRALPSDQIFPELLEHHRSRLAYLVIVFATVPAIALPLLENLSPLTPARQAALSLFAFLDIILVSFAVVIGNFPTRRRIFDDGRSLAAYLSFTLRLVIAFIGFWIVLLIVPFLLHRTGAGASGWLIAGSLCLLLLAWSRNFAAIFCYLLEAKPLQDRRLLERLENVVEKSKVSLPGIYECGPWNGGWCNAAALPSVSQPRIVMSHPLLETLDIDETTAIFAHEVGHLEDFETRNVQKLWRIEALLIGLGCFLEPALVSIDPALGPWGFWAWLPILAALLAWRVRDTQQREIACDRRAVDLTGNAEALVSGLVKVYHASKLPRRMAFHAERHSSHPSLARRIQDIRRYGVAGRNHSKEWSDLTIAPKRIENWIAPFLSREGSNRMLVIEPDRATWLDFPAGQTPEAPPASDWDQDTLKRIKSFATRHRTIKYRDLSELRLVVRKDGGHVSAAGLSEPAENDFKLISIRDEDVPALREALDRVDTRLGPLPVSVRSGHAILRFTCAATTICALLATFEGVVTFGSGLWLIVAGLVALAAGNRPWIAAFGAMALWSVLARTFLSWDKTWWSADGCILLSMLLLAGCYLLHRAFPTSKSLEKIRPPEQSPAFTAFLLLTFASLFAVLQLFNIHSDELLPRIHAFALNSPGSFLPLVGASAALMTGRRRVARLSAALIGIIGLSHAWLGSQHFLENYSRDPMVADVPGFAPCTAEYNERARISLEGSHRDLILSPGGVRFATATTERPLQSPLARVYQVTGWAGEARRIEALALHFLDDENLLTLSPDEDNGVQIQLRNVHHSEGILWHKRLPGVTPDSLFTLVGNGNKWRLTVNPNEVITMRLSGIVESDLLEMHTWSQYTPGNHWRYVGSGVRCLQIVSGGEIRRGGAASQDRLAWMFQRYWRQNELQWLGAHGTESSGTTIMRVAAEEPPFGEAEMMLFFYGPSSGWVCSADSVGGNIKPLASIEPNYGARWDGKRLVILHHDHLFAADFETGISADFPLPHKVSWNSDLALGSNAAAVSWDKGDHTEIALIELAGIKVLTPPRH